MCTAAGAVTGQDACKVTCAVAEQRHGLTVKSGKNQLTELSRRNGLQSLRIKDLNNVVVFPNVHSVLLLALNCHAGTAHFTHTEVVVCLGTPNLLNALALSF